MTVGPSLTSMAADEAAKFAVERFIVAYGREHPDAPRLDALSATTATLQRSGLVLSAEGPGDAVQVRLGDDLPRGTEITASGLQKLLAATVTKINDGGIYGVVVFPSRDQIDPQTMEDLRPAEDRTLRVVVWLSEVAQVRTVGKGSRLRGDNAISHPIHAPIASHSPLVGPVGDVSGSLIFKHRLNSYLERLNRHPGRRVEAAISSTDEPGRAVLDYLVTETKPWFAYLQLSNTGTEATDEFRQRIGLVNNQLFNRDDVLSVDVITASLDAANAAFLSYTTPIIYPDTLRGRVFGSWGNFNAELAANGALVRVNGESWTAGGELTWTPLTLWGTALDLTGGVSAQHYEVVNEDFRNTPGDADFLVGSLEARMDRATELFTFSAGLGYETQFKDIPANELRRLGRARVTDNYNLIRADVQASTYLETLFAGRERRNRLATRPLVHEIWGQLRTQWVLGDERLIPQKEQSVGGFFSARGYPESAISGDNAWLANFEYRIHLPRILRPSSELAQDRAPTTGEPQGSFFGRPFNFRPPRVAARPDWDLILRTFFDYGKTEGNRGNGPTRLTEDRPRSVSSAGLGLELQLWRNINVRADWGYALEDLRTGIDLSGKYTPGINDTKAGDSRVHLLVTLLW